jgi:2-(1,2-epoxy-1,2-dihydrophenyl)acetyl-CoA isomerase
MTTTDAAHGTAVALSIAGGVATIRLTNSQGRNTVSAGMAKELLAAIGGANADPAVRAILTVADGPVWCAGGDVSAFARLGDSVHEYARKVGVDISAIAMALHESPKITVAGVHGSVVGAGLGLMSAHDIVLAAASTNFNFAYGVLGLTPDLGGTYFVVRDIGYRRALSLYLSNDRIDAPAAEEIGLVGSVVPDEDLQTAATSIAEQLAAGPAAAHGETKRLMRQSANMLLGPQLKAEIRTLAQAMRGAEYREGLAAFGERRRPVFYPAAGD